MGVRASVWERSADPGWESVLTRPATGSEFTVREGQQPLTIAFIFLLLILAANVSLKRHEGPRADAAS